MEGGTNSRGNRYYSGSNGSYYYHNADGSTYYNSGKGSSTYTPPPKSKISRSKESENSWNWSLFAARVFNLISPSKQEEESKPKKICCACPNTKRLRDECIAEHGMEYCGKWIEAHLRCLRSEGFDV